MVLKSLSNFFGTVSSDTNPESGDQRTRDQNEGDVDDGVEWVLQHALDRDWWSEVVNKSTDWEALSTNGAALPNTQPSDYSELFEVVVNHSWNEQQIRDESALNNYWCVWSIE